MGSQSISVALQKIFPNTCPLSSNILLLTIQYSQCYSYNLVNLRDDYSLRRGLCRSLCFGPGGMGCRRVLCYNFRTIYGARNQVGIGLSYRLTRARICKRLRSLSIDSKESIPGLLKRLQILALATWAGQIDSLELISGLLKVKKIPSQH